jgi:hypothetical protein
MISRCRRRRGASIAATTSGHVDIGGHSAASRSARGPTSDDPSYDGMSTGDGDGSWIPTRTDVELSFEHVASRRDGLRWCSRSSERPGTRRSKRQPIGAAEDATLAPCPAAMMLACD